MGVPDRFEENERAEILVGSARAFDQPVALGVAPVGSVHRHEAARVAERGRRESHSAFEGAESLHGPSGDVDHRHEGGDARTTRERLEQTQPQPVGGGHARDVGRVEAERHGRDGIFDGPRLRDVRQQDDAACGYRLEQAPRDGGLRVGLHGIGRPWIEGEESAIDGVSGRTEGGAELGERGGEIGAAELDPDDGPTVGRVPGEHVVDHVPQQRLAAPRPSGHEQAR